MRKTKKYIIIASCLVVAGFAIFVIYDPTDSYLDSELNPIPSNVNGTTSVSKGEPFTLTLKHTTVGEHVSINANSTSHITANVPAVFSLNNYTMTFTPNITLGTKGEIIPEMTSKILNTDYTITYKNSSGEQTITVKDLKGVSFDALRDSFVTFTINQSLDLEKGEQVTHEFNFDTSSAELRNYLVRSTVNDKPLIFSVNVTKSD